MKILENIQSAPKLRQTVNRMISDAKLVNDERRANGRFPYFQPVMVQLSHSPALYSAFTRDISATGVGLLHGLPIQPQTITLISKLKDDVDIQVSVRIIWCVPCSEGWYISGGPFLAVL